MIAIRFIIAAFMVLCIDVYIAMCTVYFGLYTIYHGVRHADWYAFDWRDYFEYIKKSHDELIDDMSDLVMNGIEGT